MARISEDLLSSIFARVESRVDARTFEVFTTCFTNTLASTILDQPDGTLFALTGDIPAMWLRDSTAQLAPYLHFAAADPLLTDTLTRIVRRQLDYISIDPYANAFNSEPNGNGHNTDRTDLSPWVWERKYEVDSLCYPIQLAHDLWRVTGSRAHLDESFRSAAATIIDLWTTEQDHETRSAYRFERLDGPSSDSLVRDGLGAEVVPTGLTWSAFRPSDDACVLGYNVPGNIFAAVELAHIEQIALEVFEDDLLAADARTLREAIERGIRAHAVVSTDNLGEIYAYEVDGRGNHLLMDDANVPSLLALPLLGWCEPTEPTYSATRQFILSDSNPFYFSGLAAAGIGSPHTPDRHIWPIALAVHGLTSTNLDEKLEILATLCKTDAGTDLMHESFNKDDPGIFTRPWFSWANAMFCELVLDVVGLRAARPVHVTSEERR